ncbi:DUF664 domain-containing protein [Streptomyces sp. MBT53]|uniref:mycothiol transferase n=1 Tax=Streptomyces sp. MBT53 TaxID=1488384 RepID=UPI001914D04D|nr:DUF664 domain-containing protein [Streptomyces sp. MBT53]MBK6018336.1 DUF664 domain-containing protein [Streptomyces sp. MBT53]
MITPDFKAGLRVILQDSRDTLLWKLEGLSEYDIRRPMTPTGTNLLGLVKHLAGAEAFYFGTVFERPVDAPELWIASDETREQIVGDHQRICAHSDTTNEALPLYETSRQAGHADVVRELIDGAAGQRDGGDNMAPGDASW